MKAKTIFVSAIGLLLVLNTACSQNDDKRSTEIQKEVKVENVNGVKTVTITTIENGVKTKEAFTGEEADRKLAELEGEKKSSSEETTEEEVEKKIEVSVDEETGAKKVVITKRTNGNDSVELYEGSEAEEVLHELEGEMELNDGQNMVIKTKEVKRTTVKKTEDVDI